jgi:hypothetical protein
MCSMVDVMVNIIFEISFIIYCESIFQFSVGRNNRYLISYTNPLMNYKVGIYFERRNLLLQKSITELTQYALNPMALNQPWKKFSNPFSLSLLFMMCKFGDIFLFPDFILLSICFNFLSLRIWINFCLEWKRRKFISFKWIYLTLDHVSHPRDIMRS